MLILSVRVLVDLGSGTLFSNHDFVVQGYGLNRSAIE